jgi:hypothetical protein
VVSNDRVLHPISIMASKPSPMLPNIVLPYLPNDTRYARRGDTRLLQPMLPSSLVVSSPLFPDPLPIGQRIPALVITDDVGIYHRSDEAASHLGCMKSLLVVHPSAGEVLLRKLLLVSNTLVAIVLNIVHMR